MVDNNGLMLLKDKCISELRGVLPDVLPMLDGIDVRLGMYLKDILRTDMDVANVYELCGARKQIRLWMSYRLNVERLRQWIRAIEGVWEGSVWIGGGLKFSTPRGAQHVRLMPWQVWVLACMYLADVEEDGLNAAGVAEHGAEIGGVEPMGADALGYGTAGDDGPNTAGGYVRLCQEFHLFMTRKGGKTEFGAAIDYVEANVLGPTNAQVLICANSSDQSRIAFKAIKNFCYQLDPKSANKGAGKYLNVTDRGIKWQPGRLRTAEIVPMSAGGKKKDGWFGSLVHADEHGSADYVNGHSDMQSAVEVCEGSMGPRRERMLLHTTTAGLVKEGPYQIQLRKVEEMLLDEMNIPLDLNAHRTDNDKWGALLLRLDPWEVTDDLNALRRVNLYHKVNRSIGVTVQPSWYEDRIHKALTNGTDDTRREVLTKDFNIWQSNRVVEWISADEIRALQVGDGYGMLNAAPKSAGVDEHGAEHGSEIGGGEPMGADALGYGTAETGKVSRIEDCLDEDGWMVAVGMDFSLGRDLHAVTWLAIRKGTGPDGADEYFADMDGWISEETLHGSSIAPLLQRWVDAGWLHVSPGKTLEPTLPVLRVEELYEAGLNIIGFGYDANKAKMPINAISQWLVEVTGDADAPKRYLVPISQTAASYNPQVEEIDYMIRSNPAMIHFSANPLWPYEFGCAALDVDVRMENKKPVKMNPGSDACLVDHVQCLCNANAIIDRLEGSVIEV